MMSVGYRQGIEYLSGAIERDGFVEKGVAATRQLAKRQLTWLRSWPKLSPASIALDPACKPSASLGSVQAFVLTFLMATMPAQTIAAVITPTPRRLGHSTFQVSRSNPNIGGPSVLLPYFRRLSARRLDSYQ